MLTLIRTPSSTCMTCVHDGKRFVLGFPLHVDAVRLNDRARPHVNDMEFVSSAKKNPKKTTFAAQGQVMDAVTTGVVAVRTHDDAQALRWTERLSINAIVETHPRIAIVVSTHDGDSTLFLSVDLFERMNV